MRWQAGALHSKLEGIDAVVRKADNGEGEKSKG